MAYSVKLHISGETSISGEIEDHPKPTDTNIIVPDPRQKDGKNLHDLDKKVFRVIWPSTKVSSIKILKNADEEKIFGFVRG